MNHASTTPTTRNNTLLGFIAILLWSTTIAFSRSLTEQLGTLTAAFLIYGTAGMLGLLYTGLTSRGLQAFQRLPRAYLFGCGVLFVVYTAALYLAIGLARSNEQVLVVGLINYLWPALSLVFSIPLLGKRARPILLPGIAAALAGIWLASTDGIPVSPASAIKDPDAMLPYGLALIAAVCWGLYSNLSRRWAAKNDGSGVPLFLLASGITLGILRLFTVEQSGWSLGVAFELLYMAVFPAMIAYILWDTAVRKGKIVLVAATSYLTPLLSTIISVLLLNVKPGAGVWLGAGFVIAGAVLCKQAIPDDRVEG